MMTQLPWLSLLGAAVALVVGIIAFIVAGGLVDHRTRAPHIGQDRGGSAGASRGVRRAS